MTMHDDETTKALHDVVQRTMPSATTCTDFLTLARTIEHLGATDLAETLATRISAIANGRDPVLGSDAINGLLSPSDVGALVEAYEMVQPKVSAEPLVSWGR